MADEQNIGFQITVNTKPGEQNVTTLKQDINALQAAIEKASKTGISITIDNSKKTIDEAKVLLDEIKDKLNTINSHGEARAKVLNEEHKIRQAIAKEQDKQLNDEIKQLETAEKLALAEDKRRQKISAWNYDSTPKGNQLEYGGAVKQTGVMNPGNVKDAQSAFATLAARTSDINQRWADNFYNNYGTNLKLYAENAKSLKAEAAEVTTKINQMGTAFETMGNKAGYAGSFMQKLRKMLAA